MQRISTVLQESEVMAVRKAVCAEGADRVVITPIPYWLCGMDTVDLYSDKKSAKLDKKVRLEVTADTRQSERIVSAIQRTVHAGKFVFSFRQGKLAEVRSLHE
jgi:nitrogen regulatory protein PII